MENLLPAGAFMVGLVLDLGRQSPLVTAPTDGHLRALFLVLDPWGAGSYATSCPTNTLHTFGVQVVEGKQTNTKWSQQELLLEVPSILLQSAQNGPPWFVQATNPFLQNWPVSPQQGSVEAQASAANKRRRSCRASNTGQTKQCTERPGKAIRTQRFRYIPS